MRTTTSRHVRCYRALIRLYPRQFRRDFGDDLVQVFADDLTERGALLGWRRALSDLVLSVPVQHVEVTMNNHSADRSARARLVLAAFAVVVVAALGRYVVVAVPLALLAALTALLYWRSQVPYREAVLQRPSVWWRLLLGGVAVHLSIVVADNFGPDVDWFPWHLAVFLFLSAWVLVITGALLGILHMTRHLRHRLAGST